MTGTYSVKLGNTTVGTAVVEKQGLYYRFICNCDFSDKDIYTISVQSGAHCESLGVFIPVGKHYRLEKKIPVKYFPEKELHFLVTKKSTESGNQFIPLESDAQFQYLSKLKDARFQHLDGKYGVILCFERCCPPEEDAVRS